MGAVSAPPAGLLCELGFAADVNDPLRATNGVVHKVDVSARVTPAGVNVLWIVECKFWNRAVPKEMVSALKDIVNDLGADRRLLMSSNPGPSVWPVRGRTRTLSNLDELRGTPERIGGSCG